MSGQDSVSIHNNTPSGIAEYLKHHHHLLPSSLVVLETTGGYESALVRALQSDGYAVHRANTRKVKHFIRSLGQLGKSDKIDAQGLAQYGQERHRQLSLYQPKSNEVLQKLMNRRDELKRMLVQEKNRLKAPEQELVKASILGMINYINEQVEALDEQITLVYEDNPQLTELKKILLSIPGVGEVVATSLLAFIPELGQVNRKQIASLAGVAPHPNESGTKQGYRRTRGGRPEVKRILFIAAMTASRSQGELGDFYRRLVGLNKKKMVALTALMRKLIVIANARIRDYLKEKQMLSLNI